MARIIRLTRTIDNESEWEDNPVATDPNSKNLEDVKATTIEYIIRGGWNRFSEAGKRTATELVLLLIMH